MFETFLPSILDKTLSVSDRVTFLDDHSALAQAGQFDTVKLLKLIEEFREQEDDLFVWQTIQNCLSKVKESSMFKYGFLFLFQAMFIKNCLLALKCVGNY